MITISIDPGIRATGIAIFSGNILTRSGYVHNPYKSGLGPVESAGMGLALVEWLGGVKPDVLALEWPQVYQVSKGDPNDLLPLAGVDAAVVVLTHCQVSHYLPREWKGQAPKEVMCQRIRERLTPAEQLNIFDAGALTHNVLDAIGIGLHHLGRLTPKKVFAR